MVLWPTFLKNEYDEVDFRQNGVNLSQQESYYTVQQIAPSHGNYLNNVLTRHQDDPNQIAPQINVVSQLSSETIPLNLRNVTGQQRTDTPLGALITNDIDPLMKRDPYDNYKAGKHLLFMNFTSYKHFTSKTTLDCVEWYPYGTPSVSPFQVKFTKYPALQEFEKEIKPGLLYPGETESSFDRAVFNFAMLELFKFDFHYTYLDPNVYLEDGLIGHLDVDMEDVDIGYYRQMRIYYNNMIKTSRTYMANLEWGFKWIYYYNRLNEICSNEIELMAPGDSFKEAFLTIDTLFISIDWSIFNHIERSKKDRKELLRLKDEMLARTRNNF
ncbi:uncharacterized protein SAPINGB_P005322 [Magnusiomyces paraingens]|uniref:Uncharacterized protein n=1 Tax=Magnusiomyces paraingens TaxID=2606893 RepID=A0A5E8C1S3_9ASCO|nr:uncharacterized protein SAPINGB_P005322 [Saprochaete ingens]VVT56835.1 unnamed protein product [Saprochaete ingens]